MRSHSPLRFHRGEKIFFHAPFAFQFRRNIDNVQCVIANLSRLHDVRGEIIRQRPSAAVNFQSITFRQGINSAELEHAFRAAFKTA